MADRSFESLSALMDGETEGFELRRTLDRVEEEPELSDAWQRYHLIRSVMRNEAVSEQGLDISGSVMAALDNEESYNQPTPEASPEVQQSDTHNSFWKPLTSMAVAASVTAMVILGVQNFDHQAETIADNRPGYTLPAGQSSPDYVQARFGSAVPGVEQGAEPEIIRLSQGLDRYIDQHKHMLSSRQSGWQTTWLPEGFDGLRRDVMAHAEVQVFSNGRNSFTVCVEEYGRQSVPEGVATAGNMVAVGKKVGQHFVTVVGDVPLMIAERIATSVQPK